MQYTTGRDRRGEPLLESPLGGSTPSGVVIINIYINTSYILSIPRLISWKT
jgi:hypothetical protein